MDPMAKAMSPRNTLPGILELIFSGSDGCDFSNDPLEKPSPNTPGQSGRGYKGIGDGKQNHVEEHLGMDNLIAHVKKRIVNLEKLLNKKSIQAELRKKTREAAAREKEASSTKFND
ncbi:hypothetical protein HN51_013222 [Arachis hypogaea]